MGRREGAEVATRLVLDCDTGDDDAVAIMLAALHPELELVAVTTVNGNVEVNYCTANSLRVLDYIGRGKIPVYEGASSPLVRDDFPIPRAVLPSHTQNPNYSKHLDLPAATSTKKRGVAAEFLVQCFQESYASKDEVVLVATGPLTNLALAMKLDPSFASHVRRLVIMGGGHQEANETPSAEFNIWADPEAARVVLASGIDEVVLVPLDATHRALVSSNDCARLRSLGTAAARATAMLVEQRIRFYEGWQPMDRANSVPVHDALCVAYLVDPSVISIQKYWVDVETHGELTVGRTVIDTHGRSRREPNVWVALDANESLFVRILTETFANHDESLAD